MANAKTVGVFSKVGMAGGSENRVVQLCNSFAEITPTYLFAENKLSKRLKPQLNEKVMLREDTVVHKKSQYELSGLDVLIVVNSDSYSFCKRSYWDGTQGKHHKNDIDISHIGRIAFVFNYVVSPAQNLVELHKVNPNLKIMVTSDWFRELIATENKFEKLRKLNLPLMQVNSPVSSDFAQQKTPSDKIRINRHSMAFAYKHDEDNLKVIDEICRRHGDKISLQWMGVPSRVRLVAGKSKDEKTPYREILEKHPQLTVLPEYSVPVPTFLRETDILFFYISRFRKEPWPRTVAEGMMAGCCCVTNNKHGMAEQIKHKKTGFLFDDTKQAIDQLSTLIENPEIVHKVGQKAQKHAIKRFSSSKVVEQMLSFVLS